MEQVKRLGKLVVFRLADEHYGADIAYVDSIIRLQTVTAMPHAPSFMEGVINLRGTVLPIVDLRKRLGLPACEASKDSRIVVAQVGGNIVGMVVDAVLEVRSVPEKAIEPPSPLVTTPHSAFITGIAKVDDEKLIIVLDLEAVLAPEEKAELEAFQAMETG